MGQPVPALRAIRLTFSRASSVLHPTRCAAPAPYCYARRASCAIATRRNGRRTRRRPSPDTSRIDSARRTRWTARPRRACSTPSVAAFPASPSTAHRPPGALTAEPVRPPRRHRRGHRTLGPRSGRRPLAHARPVRWRKHHRAQRQAPPRAVREPTRRQHERGESRVRADLPREHADRPAGPGEPDPRSRRRIHDADPDRSATTAARCAGLLLTARLTAAVIASTSFVSARYSATTAAMSIWWP